jgi:hypothetical protein
MVKALDIIKGTRAEPRPYQRRVVSKVLDMFMGRHRTGDGSLEPNARSVLVESPTGCLTGDTVVHFNGGGKGFSMTMAEAFVHFHGGDPDTQPGECLCGCNQSTRVPSVSNRSKGQTGGVPLRFVHGHQSRAMRWEGPIAVRAYKGERGIGLQPILNIVRSGIKPVYKLTLATGQTLRGTACHPVLTEHGFVPLGRLEPGVAVVIDRLRPTPATDHKQKTRDRHISNLWNHPYGRVTKTNKERCGYTVRVPKHIAIYEANANNLSLRDYVRLCRRGDPSGLKLVDPSVYVVHHRDGDHDNDEPANLEVKTVFAHNRDHGIESHYRNFGSATPDLSEVVSVTPDGEEMTYDICCDRPYHNFIANGVVVHNSGKTVMAWLTAKCLQIEIPDLVVGWVAMRRNLLSQAATENAHKGINVRNAHMISMFDRNPEELLLLKQAGRKILLVVDEAQHDAANSMAHLHNTIEPDFILGLSATPFRTDRVKLCFDKVVKDVGIHQLIQDGYLSRYNHYSIPNWNVETVAETYIREPRRWGKSIFYFVNLEQCFTCAAILKSHGVVCDVVTGSTDVEAQLEAFRHGDIPALINCMKLTEGFDAPDLQTAFVRDSGKGCTMQMCGRAFRKFPTIDFKQIVQSKQTRWPMIRTAMPDQQYIWQEDTWLSLTVNPLLNRINQNARLAIATTEVELPQFLTQKRPKGRPRQLRF